MFPWHNKRLNTHLLSMTMIMNSSSFQWLCTLIISSVFTAFCSNSFISSASPISYADHCNAAVPESPLNKFETALSPLSSLQIGSYTGGNEILSQKPRTLMFRTLNLYKAEADGVFGIEGTLTFGSLDTYYTQRDVTERYYPGSISHAYGFRRRRNSVIFRLHGFWSESGNLCMVGTEGKLPDLAAILKLSNLKNSSSITTLVTGSLEFLSSTNDKNYFESVSILFLPTMNYKYTLVSKDLSDGFSGGNDRVKSLPLSSLSRTSFCSVFRKRVIEFNLKYSINCSSTNICSPFGSDAVGFLPRVLSLKQIECLEEEKRLRVLIEFTNNSYVGYYHHFDPNRTLIAEGYWDDKMNQLFVAACRLFNTAESLANAYIGDCTTRLSLSFPSIWSIRETSNMVGEIWSNKAVNDSGYFDKILFLAYETSLRTSASVKYEYTEVARAGKLCWPKRNPRKSKGKKYPNEFSYDMQFNFHVRRPSANSSLGYATPLSAGDWLYPRYLYRQSSLSSSTSKPSVQESFRQNSLVNISYRIGIRLQPGEIFGVQVYSSEISRSSYQGVKISAEGIYDSKTGQLCMVGCRNIVSGNQSLINDSMDCEILLNFQFPPSYPKNIEGYIKGRVKSTRVDSDPLYFEPMEVYSVSYTAAQVAQSISRMDWDIVMAIISNTLACLFVGLQLFHVKKHPEVLPSISLVMICLLTLGHMIPLMLNFEVMFLKKSGGQQVLLSNGGWLEVNEVLVRIITMVAFLLEFRLLQLTWSSKLADEADQPALWSAEKRTLILSFSLYAAGAFIFFLFNWRNNSGYVGSFSSPSTFHPPESQHSVWEGLKLYACFVLDGFLLPQILLNTDRNSKENALACSFYIGTTIFRLLTHARKLFYTNADFFSIACNIIVSFGGLMFAAIIFLQQWFGGRYIVPRKFRDGSKEYEKVPVVVSET